MITQKGELTIGQYINCMCVSMYTVQIFLMYSKVDSM